ncbi:MAG TPA: Glu/Leu/Phe/Val dehydrogenase dimerization domain-containing protein [Bacillota bacterium]|nr:Glu/Leu/Phe/Val dehydrogenase dimerization domain-containing protein [Bacillota bacterium]
MEIFKRMELDNYEQVLFCQDKGSGLKAIIAIHDTTLGPAVGGARMWPYESEEEALEDALRLAKGMTYKNAAAGLNFGGGKAVIIGDAKKDKSEQLFRSLGRYIQGLGGRYITAEDVGTTTGDMDQIHIETDYVVGTSGYGASGNPAPVTAYGLYKGIKATAKEAFGDDSLSGKTVAVQGVGNVAYRLCEHLHNEGAKLIVTDINKEAVQRAVDNFGAKAVEPDDIYGVDCDIYSPCALGAVINDDTIPQIKAKVIAGSANNQLQSDKHGDLLFEKDIVYAPDFVINSGGVINVADELNTNGYNAERAMVKVEEIYDNLNRVFEISRRDNIPTYVAADRMAEERIEAIKNARGQFLMDGLHSLSRKNI